jgi:hypothetical protein
MNLANTIIPKSDQLNADDLITGPRVILITGVEAGSAEQPVLIHYEGEAGRPYKPGKSMRRVLVSIWGTDGNAYSGRSLCLYRNPAIRFGSDPVGGIRISHASHIPEAISISLTETRGRRKPFRVEPMPDGDAAAAKGTKALQEWFTALSGFFKHALKPRLDGEWKKVAAEADKKGVTS